MNLILEGLVLTSLAALTSLAPVRTEYCSRVHNRFQSQIDDYNRFKQKSEERNALRNVELTNSQKRVLRFYMEDIKTTQQEYLDNCTRR